MYVLNIHAYSFFYILIKKNFFSVPILFNVFKKHFKSFGNTLGVQWLGLRASTAGGTGSIPGVGTRILHVTRRSQKKNFF